MGELVYPLSLNQDHYLDLKTSFSETDFVKIQPKKINSKEYHSVLMAISNDYQILDNDEKRDQYCEQFKTQLKNFLLSPTNKTKKEIYERVKEAYSLSKLQYRYCLSFTSDREDIFDLQIIKKPNSKDEFLNLDTKFELFDEQTKKIFKSDSNIFGLLDTEFLKEMIDQRYLTEDYKEKIKLMEKAEEKDDLLDDDYDIFSKIKEIVSFNTDRDNNMMPSNIYNMISTDSESPRKLYIKFLSSVLKFNVFICRAWNKEITVIKKIKIDKDLPSILLFKLGNKRLLTGKNEEESYETGGIKLKGGIKTLLNPKFDSKVITDLNSIYYNEADSFFMDKYLSHLNKLEQSIDIDTFNYQEEDKPEEKEEDKPEEKEDYTMYDEDTMVPEFISNYTRTELEDLLKIFINFDSNKNKELSKKKLEVIYKDFFQNNMMMTVEDLISSSRSLFV